MFSAGLQLLCLNTPCAEIFSQDDVRCFHMFQRCFQMFSAVFRCSQEALNWSQIFYRDSQMCSRCSQMFTDVFRMLRWVLWPWAWWILWSFQMKVCTLMIQRNLMIPSYSMINIKYPKVNGDTSISDGLVLNSVSSCVNLSNMKTY